MRDSAVGSLAPGSSKDIRGKLTKRTVDALKSDVWDQFIWDTEIPGFGCKVTPKGARIYILQYGRLGRDHRVTIGRHGSDVTAEQARLEALRLRGIVAAGENPATVSSRGQCASTVSDLGERYMTEYAKEHKKPSAVAQDRRELAEGWKIRPKGSNPCRGLKHYAENRVERFLSADEFSRLGAALVAAESGRLTINEASQEAASIKKKRGGQRKIGPRSENA